MSHDLQTSDLIGLPIIQACWLSTTNKVTCTRPSFWRVHVRVWAWD